MNVRSDSDSIGNQGDHLEVLEQEWQTQGVDDAGTVRFLSNPGSYPDVPAHVEVVETHFAWVFLTPNLAYKLKKPGRRPPMDLSTVDARRLACQEELRLNQRWAPGVYLEVIPVVRDRRGHLRIGGDGRPVEWLIKMQRLPADRMLDNAIRDGTASRGDIDRLGTTLTGFYVAAPPAGISGRNYIDGLRQSVQQTSEEIAVEEASLSVKSLDLVAPNLIHFITDRAGWLEARVAEGRVIECHGDLRPEHICLCEPVQIIDRLEFSKALRILDVLEELAFFSLECEQLGAGWVSERILEYYLQRSGDRAPRQLMRFYRSHRSLVRAMLMTRRIREAEPADTEVWREKAARYLAVAQADSAESTGS